MSTIPIAEDAAPSRPGLYRLLAWSSPAFPTGAFAYSHGLETAVFDRAIVDRATLQDWVAAVVTLGGGRLDADLLRDAYRAAQSGEAAALAEINARSLAYRSSAELALESTQQGAAFTAAYRAAWAVDDLEATAPHPDPLPASGESESDGAVKTARPACGEKEGAIPPGSARRAARGQAPAWEGEGQRPEATTHPVAFGAAAAQAGIALADALVAYLQAFAGNLVSAGIRLGVIGQSDGQRIVAALEPDIVAAATIALTRAPADFGGATFAADLASMAHETLYTRLFRS